jgi:hypothetical protein
MIVVLVVDGGRGGGGHDRANSGVRVECLAY